MDGDQTLLYLGAGLTSGGLLLGLIIGVIFAVNERAQGFRYGSFFLGMNLVLVPCFGLGVVMYYYQFLDGGLAHAVAIPQILLGIGVLVAYKCLRFRSKALFWITSIPYLLSIYLSPVAIFNIVYIYAIYKPGVLPPELPEESATSSSPS
ncbi:MAG: hypothetical protein AAFX93_16365 [Verrucomicrobiota bacterium]